jgi:hypothetical protein
MPELVTPSSTNHTVWDAPKIPDHNIHRFDATNPFDGHLGLEYATEIVTLQFTHNPFLFIASYRLNLLSRKQGTLYCELLG